MSTMTSTQGLEELGMTSADHQRRFNTSGESAHGLHTAPTTQPLEAKSIPPEMSNTLEQIVGQLDILTQVWHLHERTGYDMKSCFVCLFSMRPDLKKLMFPVQWVAEIVASLAAAIYFSFFFNFFFWLVGKYCPFKKKKKSPQSPLF